MATARLRERLIATLGKLLPHKLISLPKKYWLLRTFFQTPSTQNLQGLIFSVVEPDRE